MQNNGFALSVIVVYILVMFIAVLTIPYGAESIYIYQNKTPELITFFRGVTFFGEWIGLVVLGLYFLFKQDWRGLSYAVVGYLPSFLVMSTAKKWLNEPRPLSSSIASYIGPLDGVRELHWYSMPSGHTYNAFFIATFVVSYFKLNNVTQLIIILTAILVGLSRIVLLHHFKEDVLAGSALGVIGGLLPFVIFTKQMRYDS